MGELNGDKIRGDKRRTLRARVDSFIYVKVGSRLRVIKVRELEVLLKWVV
jgi:hypothetical protein